MIPADPDRASTYVGLGWVMCDHVMQLSTYPVEDQKQIARGTFTQAGGPVVRALLQLRRFGQNARLISIVGNDLTGQQILSELRDSGMDTRLTATDSRATTPVAHVWLSAATGSRTIAYSAVAPEIQAQFDAGVLNDAVAVLLDGRHPVAAARLTRLAVARGIPVAIDTGNYKDHLTELLGGANIVIGPKDTWLRMARELGYRDPLDAMRHFNQATCVSTNGLASVIALSDSQEVEYVPTPVRATDSNGAGDVFFGAFVWARSKSSSVAECIGFAAAAAAAKCRRLGNRRLPSLDDVLAEWGQLVPDIPSKFNSIDGSVE